MWRQKVTEAIVAGNVFQFGGFSKPMTKQDLIFSSSSSSSSEDSEEDERRKSEHEKDEKMEGGNGLRNKGDDKSFSKIPEESGYCYSTEAPTEKKVFNADGNRNNLIFENDILMDKKSGAYIDTNRAVDNVMDIKTVMKKQRQNAEYRKKKSGSLIDEEESESCGIVACIRRAKNQYDRGNIDSAISYLDAAIKFGTKELERTRINAMDDKDVIKARILRAKCYIKKGKAKESLKESERILKVQKKNPQAIFIKAESYYFQSKFEKALLYYHQGNRLRTPLYTEKFRLGIAKATDAIMKTISILDDPGTSAQKKDDKKKSFRSRVELVKKYNRFNRMDLDYSTSKNTIDFADSVLISTKKKLLDKKPMVRIKSEMVLDSLMEKPHLRAINRDLNRLQIEQDFLESISEAITPKEEEIPERETRNNRISNKKKKTPPQPKSELLEFTHETMGFINKRRRFWASLSINKSNMKEIAKEHKIHNRKGSSVKYPVDESIKK